MSPPPPSPPASAEAAGSVDVDSLVAETALKIAHAINGLKSALNARDCGDTTANGTLMLTLKPQTFQLNVTSSGHGAEHPVTVQVTLKESESALGDHNPPIHSTSKPVSDAELEKDIIPRNKRKTNPDDDGPNKRRRVDEDEDIMPLITKEDLQHLLTTLREDIQEDTSECVNHVQRLLRRFKQEWHEASQWGQRQPPSSQQTRASLQDAVPSSGAAPAVSFPSPTADREDQDSSTADIIRREARLLSSQIKWVDDCRKVAADVYDKKEELWRVSSAGFHDRQRQDREAFQNRMLHESGMHAQTLNQILNEVKAISLYAQSMKWETPASYLTYPSPTVPTPPAFPTLPAPPALNPTGRGRGRGQGRGQPAYRHHQQ